VNATAVGENNDNSKDVKEEEKEGNWHSPHVWSPSTFQPWLHLWL